MKPCTVCGEIKPLSEFYLYTTRTGEKKPMGRCKACHKVAVVKSAKGTEAKRKADAKYAKSQRRNRRRKAYGLSELDLLALEASGGGVCPICGTAPEATMHIDHDHETGKVRGLLCPGCNVGLGAFKDDPLLLLKAARYLALWQRWQEEDGTATA